MVKQENKFGYGVVIKGRIKNQGLHWIIVYNRLIVCI
jgi:hypothetical protein